MVKIVKKNQSYTMVSKMSKYSLKLFRELKIEKLLGIGLENGETDKIIPSEMVHNNLKPTNRKK